MSKIVELVATAIGRHVHIISGSCDLEAAARAAIEAIRDPSDAMMDAGLKDYLDQERRDFGRMPWNGRRMFHAMIDAELAKK